MGRKKIIDSKSLFIVALFLLSLAAGSGYVIVNMAQTLYTWTKGPIIKGDTDFTTWGDEYL
jgi:hypothetical protein